MEFLEPILAAVAAFGLGFVWYTALFGEAWRKETGLTVEEAQSDMLRTHGLSFLMMCIIASGINYVVNLHGIEEQNFVHGGFHGALSAMMSAIPLMAINYLYQRKSLKLFLIDAGYALAFFAVAGGVCAALKF